jgi:type VI secretion system protein ImpM
MIMTPPTVPGLYGKLPAAGDFVSRRLPAGFIRTWDAWIQSALTASREQLEADWLDVYLTSPIWRFIISPGSGEERAAVGILMPSVDKVGRYFPLTLAAMLDHRHALPHLFVAAADWFDALEQLALSALADGFQMDTFDRELQALALDPSLPSAGDPQPDGGRNRESGAAPIRIEMEALEHLPDAFRELGTCLLMRHYATYSLWSTDGSDLLHPSLLIYRGLPPATDFSGFLTGDWLRFGESKPIVTSSLMTPARLSPANDPGDPVETEGGGPIRWRSRGRTDVGKVRAFNEDAFMENPVSGVWAVADGMGGHLAGDEASQAIVDGLRAISAKDTLERMIADVRESLQETNAKLLRRSRNDKDGQIMGSTVVVMLALANRCATLWAGDSRLYRFRGGQLSQLTRDHSPDSEIENPDSTAPEDQNSSNIVTRALGAETELILDTVVFEASPGDRYLLCSDGLVKAVNAQEIAGILRQTDPDQSSRALIDLALARNARDNVTVIVVTTDGQAAACVNTP